MAKEIKFLRAFSSAAFKALSPTSRSPLLLNPSCSQTLKMLTSNMGICLPKPKLVKLFSASSIKASHDSSNIMMKMLSGLMLGVLLVGYAGNGADCEAFADESQSRFEDVAIKLGLKKAKQQDALLKIFYYAGYLDSHRLWNDINNVPGLKNHALEVFKIMYPALIAAHADQPDATVFKPELLRKYLFESSLLTEVEAADLLLYIAQNAFGRDKGEERYQLKSQDWMEIYKDQYIEAARDLGLIDAIEPHRSEYDEGWIAGASRIGVYSRIVDLLHIIKARAISIKGDTKVLAGGRELWAEIDGISKDIKKVLENVFKNDLDINDANFSLPVGNVTERTEEGKEYILGLVARHNIRIDKENPFVRYVNKADCPKGREPNRWYLNYAEGETKRVNESMMSQDLLKVLAEKRGVKIVDTKSTIDGSRPDTVNTAVDAAKEFITKINHGDFGVKKTFYILYETNNPYIWRQVAATQLAVDSVLKDSGLDKKGIKIVVEGVGFRNKQDVATTHGEIAALISELEKDAMERGEINKHDITPLFYQNRKEVSVPHFPDVSGWNLNADHADHMSALGQQVELPEVADNL